jgi:hypothetical protein
MKKIFAALLLSTLLAPAFASADAYGIQPTLGQLLSRIAALEAIVAGKQIGCATTATKTVVKVGEVTTIAWGSYGTDAKYSTDAQNAYSQNGEQAVSLETPQTRTYYFTFYGPNGSSVKCDQTITATR